MNISDIKFHHSGGVGNTDPLLDLGGIASIFEITDGLGNLFNNLTPTQSLEGLIDYRCFYIFNENSTDSLINPKLYIQNQKISGSFIEIGVEKSNEIQEIELTGTPNEGEILVLNVNGEQFITTFTPILSYWKEDFQNQIRSIKGMNDVIVELSGELPNITFAVNFLGQAQKKLFSLMTVVDNNLTDTIVNISKISNGKPINQVAQTIASTITAPKNIDFSNIALGNPIKLGNLNPGEGLAVWAKRTTPANTRKKTNDYFITNITGSG